MQNEQLSFFPQKSLFPYNVLTEFEGLKSSLIPHCQDAAEITLQMSFLDPQFTSSQAIGTFLHDNLVLRLHASFAHGDFPIKSYYNHQRFLLDYTSLSNTKYVLPIHRCNENTYNPKGGKYLKKQVRSVIHQLSLFDNPFIGLFIGIIFQESNGLIEVFLGHLQWQYSARKWVSTKLYTLFSKTRNTVDLSRLHPHEHEKIKEPEVKFKKS